LVVDDNVDAAELLCELLQTAGHATAMAHDGPEALGKAGQFRPTAALLDIGLPRMDGYMVAHAIRERFALASKRPRLFALTGYGRDEDRQTALKAGFDGHLAKPVDPRLLLQIVGDEAHSFAVSRQSG
jgi:CheY-like chemotaxis protein